jgi:hypothetical protein
VFLAAAVVIVIIVCATVIVINGNAVPDWFAVLAGTSAGVLGGVALPTGTPVPGQVTTTVNPPATTATPPAA